MPMSGSPLIWDLPMRWGAPAMRSPACRSRAAECPEAWIASRAVAQVAQAFAGEPDVVEGDGAAVPGRRLGLEADRDGRRGSSIVKKRIIRHVVPSKDAWYAKAWSMRETRSHTERPSTTNALASSATPRLTTETTMGSPAGEYSKQSLAQCRSSIHSSSTPASNVEAKSTAHAGAELEVAGRWDPEQRRGVEHGLRVERGVCAGVDEDVAVRVGGHSDRAGRPVHRPCHARGRGEREGHAGCSKSRHLISDLQVKGLVGPQLRAAIRVVTVNILSVGGVGRFHSAARARSELSAHQRWACVRARRAIGPRACVDDRRWRPGQRAWHLVGRFQR